MANNKNKQIIKCQVQMMMEEHDAPTKILVPDGATHFGSEMHRIWNKSDVMPRALMDDPFRILERSTKTFRILQYAETFRVSVFPRALMDDPSRILERGQNLSGF